ncbi:hypothetical protein HDU88_007593 [Geranomyces variabilis]|nr:hypothetical protein HDU88_007593 [Geranomyces variabilis]
MRLAQQPHGCEAEAVACRRDGSAPPPGVEPRYRPYDRANGSGMVWALHSPQRYPRHHGVFGARDLARILPAVLGRPKYFRDGEEPQIRKRGVPISHVLSTAFAESLLFLMDMYVHRGSGVLLHRIHDDFWFWGREAATAVRAWEAMQRFATLTCLKFNMEKSGSVVVYGPEKLKQEGEQQPMIYGPSPLPQSSVRWGLIALYSDAVFRVQDSLLDPHVVEMKQKLTDAKSVMAWVTVFHRYMSFFLRNCGKSSHVFGLDHIDLIDTARYRIQKLNSLPALPSLRSAFFHHRLSPAFLAFVSLSSSLIISSHQQSQAMSVEFHNRASSPMSGTRLSCPPVPSTWTSNIRFLVAEPVSTGCVKITKLASNRNIHII